MEVTNVVDLKALIDEMDYDCRKKDPVHYNNIINNLKNLHSLCKTEEDRELFTTYLSAATSPVVMADLIQAELNTTQNNLTETAINEVYAAKEAVDESAKELEQMRVNVTPGSEMVTLVNGTSEDGYIAETISADADKVVLPAGFEGMQEETELGRSR